MYTPYDTSLTDPMRTGQTSTEREQQIGQRDGWSTSNQ